jgi:RNA polymerase sigma factor (sigma-70 family)
VRSDELGRASDPPGSEELGQPLPVTASGPYERIEDACAAEYPRLVRILTLYCGDREAALDLAQEALARGCAHWRRVRAMDDQRAWFTRVALNLANSRWRRLRRERSTLGVLAQPAPAPAPDMALALTLRAAVSALTPRQRMAVVLRYFEDLDLASAALVMGCSQSTAKKLTARGLAALRQQLELDAPFDGDER